MEREPDPRILAELSALADGTLEPERVAGLRERIAGSPELSARYERERRAVVALQSLRADQAPASLRFGIETRRQRGPSRRWRLLYGGAFAATAALAATVLVLLLPGGPGAPSVSQAAALALRGPVMAAPSHGAGEKLQQGVGELYFPDWSVWFGWRAVGQRIDHINGKLAVTVYYARGGRTIAYTILSAPVLRWPGPRMLHLDGIQLQRLIANGRLVVTWRRSGHTCILSGAGATTQELATLAGWKPSARS